MLFAADYRRVARRALKGCWGVAIAVTLIACLLGANAGNSRTTVNFDNQQTPVSLSLPNYMAMITGFFPLSIPFALAYGVCLFLFGGAAGLGLRLYNINLILRRQQGAFNTLLERFSIFGKALGLQVVMGVMILAWALLLVIPGIIATYRYAMAPYIMAQNPETGIMEAIRRSKELMHGHKARLFCLHISFIGWSLLAGLTFGIGFLWLNPYQCAAECAFYLELTGQLPPMHVIEQQ